MEFSSSRLVSDDDTLMENWGNFKQSRCPSRIMFFGDNGWRDFSMEVFEVLKTSFLERKTTVEVPMEGSCSTGSSVVEFLRMTQTDMTTGRERSISWIDADGTCFFPRRIIGFERELPVKSLNKEVVGRSNVVVLTSPDSTEEHSDESSTTSWEGRRRWSGSEPVKCDDKYYRAVEKSFISDMLKADVGVTVTGISRCTFLSPLADGRRKAFRAMVEATTAVRGNPNIRFGWYATSSDGVASVLQHGFGIQDLDGLGPSGCYGRGVHFARPEFVHRICGLPEVDDGGERHVVLCRIIVGNVEKVERCSQQFRPSNNLYDCGVDDLKAPSWYIIWGTHMNTHVIPECVVSYRLSDGFGKRKSSPVKGMTFSQLLADIARSLPPSAIRTLDMLFDRYKERKLQKDVFIRQIRSIAGNKLLMEAMKKFSDRF